MKNTIQELLAKLHKDATNDDLHITSVEGRPMQASDFENAYLPITKEQGQWLRQLIVDNQMKSIVEFGTSFGISTIYLADGVKETGGKVVTTELLSSKAERATKNLSEAGLTDYVDLRVGDAMKTLEVFGEKIDFLFLDGWKDLYLPLFKMLEPLFHDKTMIYADNMDFETTKAYRDHIASKAAVYQSQYLHNGKGLISRRT